MFQEFLTEHPLSDCDFRQGLTMSLELRFTYTSTELRDRQRQLHVSRRNGVEYKSQIKPKSESQHIGQTLASDRPALKNLLPLRSDRTIRQISQVETSPDDVRQQTEVNVNYADGSSASIITVIRVHVHPFHFFSLSTSHFILKLKRTTINCLMHANTFIFLAYFRVTA
jgi:hypothetical protein